MLPAPLILRHLFLVPPSTEVPLCSAFPTLPIGPAGTQRYGHEFVRSPTYPSMNQGHPAPRIQSPTPNPFRRVAMKHVTPCQRVIIDG